MVSMAVEGFFLFSVLVLLRLSKGNPRASSWERGLSTSVRKVSETLPFNSGVLPYPLLTPHLPLCPALIITLEQALMPPFTPSWELPVWSPIVISGKLSFLVRLILTGVDSLQIQPITILPTPCGQ